MEYRKRRTRRRTRSAGYGRSYRSRSQEGSGFGGAMLILLFTAALIYVLFGTNVGSWLTHKLFSGSKPLEGTPDPSAIFSSAKPRDTDSMKIQFEKLDAYALQLGVYTDINSASGLVSSLKSLGAAGYGLELEGNVRIIASAYSTAEAAQSVCTRLIEQGYECIVLPLSADGPEIEVFAEETMLNGIRQSVEFSGKLVADLYGEVIAFDKEEKDTDHAKAIINEFLSNIRAVRSVLSSAEDSSGIVGLLNAFYTNVEQLLSECADAEPLNRVEMSGKLKYVQVGVIDNYYKLLNALKSYSG